MRMVSPFTGFRIDGESTCYSGSTRSHYRIKHRFSQVIGPSQIGKRFVIDQNLNRLISFMVDKADFIFQGGSFGLTGICTTTENGQKYGEWH